MSQKKKGVIMLKPRYTIFYREMNILQYFHICISVPLIKTRSEVHEKNMSRKRALNFDQ